MQRSLIAAIAVALIATACTSGDDTADPTTTTESASVASTTTTTLTASTTTTSTPPETTTTTEPPPQPSPPGVWWQDAIDISIIPRPGTTIRGMDRIGDEVWVYGSVLNTAHLQRSLDGGHTWTPVDLQPAPDTGAYAIYGILKAPDGGYLAWGVAGTRCQINEEVEGGFHDVGYCRRFRPVVHLSDDGESWRRVEPANMERPGDSTLMPNGVVATTEGYLMATTVRGPDWHVRLYSSPDGATWSFDREVRSEDGHPLSAEAILADGESVVLLGAEHPCSRPNDTTPGWILGAQWASHARVFQGSSMDDLELAAPGDHPFAREPLEVDCTETRGFDLVGVPYGNVFGEMVNGFITVFDLPPAPTGDDVDPATDGTRTWAQLVDGEWQTTTIDGVAVLPSRYGGMTYTDILDVDGAVGLLEYSSDGPLLSIPTVMLPGVDGYEIRTAERGVIARAIDAGVWVDDHLVIAGRQLTQPFSNYIGGDNFNLLRVWRSEHTTEPPIDTCVLEPGADCRFVDLSTLDGYPDFAGMDLRGIDFTLADLGDANLTGADLAGALLWSADAGSGLHADGATFDGAQVMRTWLASARDASFVNARINGTIEDATGSDFTGADLSRGTLEFESLPVLDDAILDSTALEVIWDETGATPYEIDLSGLDLREAKIQGSFQARSEGVLLVITGLAEAMLDGASFRGVDLRQIDPEEFDSTGTDIEVWDDSICPDGLPPDDPPIGTCGRQAEE